MRHYNDPTANQALSAVDREWKQMAKLAERIHRDPYSDWAIRASRRFTGIFARLLDDPAGGLKAAR